jgi:aspartate kinase
MPIKVLSSFKKSQGTIVKEEVEGMERPLVTGISAVDNETKLTIREVKDIPGIAAKILRPISEAGIDIDVIVQNISADNITDFTFTVDKSRAEEAEEILNKCSKELGSGEIDVDSNIAKISVVGIGMMSHAGIATQMFETLAEANINILMITTSEIKISVVIKKDVMKDAVVALHDAFELEEI